MKVKHEDDEQKAFNWRQDVKLDPKSDAHRDKIIRMMTVFESMQCDHLGCISVAKHRTELTSDKVRPVHCAPYRAGPRAHEFEMMDMDKMLKMGDIEPAKT